MQPDPLYADCNFYVGTELDSDGDTRVYVYRLTLANEYALAYFYAV